MTLKHSVLVIDDDEMTLALLASILEDGGFAVYSTADGPRGVALYKEFFPDLVLLDIGLPTVSGIDVLKELKSIDEAARVVIISGYVSEQTNEDARKMGAAGVLQKPFTGDALLKTIESVLSM